MGVRYLLDTHVLLWLLTDPERVPEGPRRDLSATDNDILVSAASALEVATKVRIGKLDAVGLVDAWDRQITDIGAKRLSISTGHALLAGTMRWEHRDPFDRLLVAQATLEGLTLVTVDRTISGLPVPNSLTW